MEGWVGAHSWVNTFEVALKTWRYLREEGCRKREHEWQGTRMGVTWYLSATCKTGRLGEEMRNSQWGCRVMSLSFWGKKLSRLLAVSFWRLRARITWELNPGSCEHLCIMKAIKSSHKCRTEDWLLRCPGLLSQWGRFNLKSGCDSKVK